MNEWLAFQSHLQAFDRYKDKAISRRLHAWIATLAQHNNVLPLFMPLLERSKDLSQSKSIGAEGIVKELNSAIDKCEDLSIYLSNGEELEVRPVKLTHMESGYCLIAQEHTEQTGFDKTVCFIPVKEIVKLSPRFIQKNSRELSEAVKNVSVSDFVEALQSLVGSKLRLVLKVLAPEKLVFTLPESSVDNPFMTNSSDGSLIWSATVDVTPHLFDWLFENRKHFTVLDPSDFKRLFEDYCHQLDSDTLKTA
jgi:hypothetical protein